MREPFWALLVLCGISSGIYGAGQPAPKSAVDALARYRAPSGWKVEKKSGADPSVELSRGKHLIRIRLLGGKGSRYGKARDFLEGFEARTMGEPAVQTGTVSIQGLTVPLYQVGYPIDLGDPHVNDPSPPHMAWEEFCIVPVGKRFFVLSYAHESFTPDPTFAGEKAWKAFLKTFKSIF